MKKLIIVYNQDGTYTVGQDNWTLTGSLQLISKVFDNCFEEGQFIEKLKQHINE